MKREYACKNQSCEALSTAPTVTADTVVACDLCGEPMEIVLFPVAVVFTGQITARYNDRNIEGSHMDGHYAWRKKSSVSGNPEPVWIDTWQAQKEFCKAEGLANPKEMPRNFEISEDGKSVKNTCGMPGCEI